MPNNPFAHLPQRGMTDEEKEVAAAPPPKPVKVPALVKDWEPTPTMLKALAVHLDKAPRTDTELTKLAGISATSMTKWRKNPNFRKWWREEHLDAIDHATTSRLSSIINKLLDRCDTDEADPADIKLVLNDLMKLTGHLKSDSGDNSVSNSIVLVLPPSEGLPSPTTLLQEEAIDADYEVVTGEEV